MVFRKGFIVSRWRWWEWGLWFGLIVAWIIFDRSTSGNESSLLLLIAACLTSLSIPLFAPLVLRRWIILLLAFAAFALMTGAILLTDFLKALGCSFLVGTSIIAWQVERLSWNSSGAELVADASSEGVASGRTD